MGEKRARLLIVDDQPTNLQLLKNIFKTDYQTSVATNGEEALRQAKLFAPDLILLDIMMPGIDGFEVCRQLQDDPATMTIPVIFVTAMDGDQPEIRGLETGAVDYVTKPINPKVVRARVETHIKLKQRSEQLARLADLDGLTGIANRRTFDRTLQQELTTAVRTEVPLGVLLIDVDFFKPYNDYYGHLSGDKCLRRIAQALQESLPRTTDLVGRFGGEEFGCILFDTDLAGTERVAVRLHDAVGALHIEHLQSTVTKTVTVSIGGCSLTPKPGSRPDDFLTTADQQLYLAKSSGRNRTCLCDGVSPLCQLPRPTS